LAILLKHCSCGVDLDRLCELVDLTEVVENRSNIDESLQEGTIQNGGQECDGYKTKVN